MIRLAEWWTRRRVNRVAVRLAGLQAKLSATHGAFDALEGGTRIPAAIMRDMRELPGQIAELDEAMVQLIFGGARHAVDDRQISGHARVRAMTEADPYGRSPQEPGAKLDAGKLLPWLCISGFAHALSAVADVTTKGAEKYTPSGWRDVPDGEARYMEAFARHALALARGEVVDPDTQCQHKAQMVWNLLASLELEIQQRAKHEKANEKLRGHQRPAQE